MTRITNNVRKKLRGTSTGRYESQVRVVQRSLVFAIAAILLAAQSHAAIIHSTQVTRGSGAQTLVHSWDWNITANDNTFATVAKIFDITLNSSSLGASFSSTSATDFGFDGFVAAITDGIGERIGTSGLFGAEHAFGSPEKNFLHESLSAPPDLQGLTINAMRMTIDSISFESPGSDPNNDGNWTSAFLTFTLDFLDVAPAIVDPGTDVTGSSGGGSTTTGGIDFDFEDTTGGDLTATFTDDQTPAETEADLLAQGIDAPTTFGILGNPTQLWEITFDGAFTGTVDLTFAYDHTILDLAPGQTEADLFIGHYDSLTAEWEALQILDHDLTNHTITVRASSFSPFLLGIPLSGTAVIPEPSTFALGILGLLGLGFATWRRRRRS